MSETLRQLALEIARARDGSSDQVRITTGFQFTTTVAFWPRYHASPRHDVAAFIRSLGFRWPENGWREVDLAQARRILKHVLRRDLAYGSERIPEAEAERLVTAFLGAVGNDLSGYTNGTWGLPPEQLSGGVTTSASWSPITDSTFDGGVVCVGSERLGIIWVQDED